MGVKEDSKLGHGERRWAASRSERDASGTLRPDKASVVLEFARQQNTRLLGDDDPIQHSDRVIRSQELGQVVPRSALVIGHHSVREARPKLVADQLQFSQVISVAQGKDSTGWHGHGVGFTAPVQSIDLKDVRSVDPRGSEGGVSGNTLRSAKGIVEEMHSGQRSDEVSRGSAPCSGWIEGQRP